MILVCSSFRMGSLKSFCAKRHTLGGALQGCACVPSLGGGCITPTCVYFSSFDIDNLSRHSCKFPKIFTDKLFSYSMLNIHIYMYNSKYKCSSVEGVKRAGRGGRW